MAGALNTIVGPMGSGKTERLIEVYERLLAEGKEVKIFKPTKDTRTESFIVQSRNGKTAPAIPVVTIKGMYGQGIAFQNAILIDEIQFFEQEDLVESLLILCLLGLDVYCFGLDVTSEGKTFGQVGHLLAMSDGVDKLQCGCTRCGQPARISSYQGAADKTGDVKVGDLDDYSPLCKECFYQGGDAV